MVAIYIAAGLLVLLLVLAVRDRLQREHSIISNFPIVGRLRYWLVNIGPELRQYIVASNDEERPFSRDQRHWVYASARKDNNYFGFGTDNDLELTPGYLIIRQSAFPIDAPHDDGYSLPCAKVLGGTRGRPKAFRPASVVNTSAMSYGSLSSAAVEAINRGVAIAGALQNTGEGGISEFHRKGGELIWQIGTGYFACRDDDGNFSMKRFVETLATAPVRAVEIKLSQGAKPGLGGVLPKAKITAEISKIRHIPRDRDCISPASHSAFSDVPTLVEFVERLAEASGLPIGIKSAVGEMAFWEQLADHMKATGRGPDFITIDGGEGGTGAAPLVFSDYVSLPFKLAFTSVYKVFAERGIHEDVVFIGSGKLGFPQQTMLALALGCDMVNVGREAMLAVGCIQAQKCHTGECPTGVATQKPWLVRGLDPTVKSARLANYLITLRKDLLALAHACGELHPAIVPLDRFSIIDGFTVKSAREMFGYDAGWGLPTAEDQADLRGIMRGGDAVGAAPAAGHP